MLGVRLYGKLSNINMNINRETDALIVVDMQNDFADQHGSLYVKGGEEIVGPINYLMSEFDTVVFTQDWHPVNHTSFNVYGGPWPKHCVQGSWGAEFHPWLVTFPASLIIRKGMNKNVDSYSAFRENSDASGNRKVTGLAGFLREKRIRKTYYVGVARDYCVKWSAEDAYDFNPHVVWDLTRAVDESNNSTFAELNRRGVVIL